MPADDHTRAKSYSGSRCPECFWGLYDGYRCQNPNCEETVVSRAVYMTNAEAADAIKRKAAMDDDDEIGEGTSSPVT